MEERRIVESRPIPLALARRLAEERLQEGETGVSPILLKARDYLDKYGLGDPDKAVETVEKLKELGLDEVVAVNIVNICPRSPGEVRSILMMKKEAAYDEELVSKILETIEDFCSTTVQEA